MRRTTRHMEGQSRTAGEFLACTMEARRIQSLRWGKIHLPTPNFRDLSQKLANVGKSSYGLAPGAPALGFAGVGLPRPSSPLLPTHHAQAPQPHLPPARLLPFGQRLSLGTAALPRHLSPSPGTGLSICTFDGQPRPRRPARQPPRSLAPRTHEPRRLSTNNRSRRVSRKAAAGARPFPPPPSSTCSSSVPAIARHAADAISPCSLSYIKVDCGGRSSLTSKYLITKTVASPSWAKVAAPVFAGMF